LYPASYMCFVLKTLPVINGIWMVMQLQMLQFSKNRVVGEWMTLKAHSDSECTVRVRSTYVYCAQYRVALYSTTQPCGHMCIHRACASVHKCLDPCNICSSTVRSSMYRGAQLHTDCCRQLWQEARTQSLHIQRPFDFCKTQFVESCGATCTVNMVMLFICLTVRTPTAPCTVWMGLN